MKKILNFNLLLGVLLAGSSVVADDASQIATGSKMIAKPRHASAIPLEASATVAVSATTSNFNLTTAGPATNALPPLPPHVSCFFRQPIGPRGLEHTERLRSLEGRRTRIHGADEAGEPLISPRELLDPTDTTQQANEHDQNMTTKKLFQLAMAAALPATAIANNITGPSSSESSYLLSARPGVVTVSVLTVGDSVNFKPDGVTPYRLVGIPDGLGAFDNGDATFTLVMNHELPVNVVSNIANPVGGMRAHGNAGAFVSMWTIDKSTLQVMKGEDLLQNNTSIFLSNNDPSTGTPHTGFLPAATTAMGRLCSADLAPVSAYSWTDPATGVFYGTTARIFQTGEEQGGVATNIVAGGDLGPKSSIHYGRQWNMILTDDPNIPGDQSRTAYEMPHCGLFAWENNLANPFSQRLTITAGMDDGSPIGQLYFWIGQKQTTGNVVERAGLTRQSTNDNMWVVKIPALTNVDGSGVPIEDRAVPVSGPKGNSVPFQMLKSGNDGDVSGLTFAQFEADSDGKGATQFLRPEDGQWDPNNPSDYYFVTTDRYDQVKDGVGTQVGRSRLYRVSFSDISNPALGGTITCLLDGTEAGNMFDNMTISPRGSVLLQEDPGNQARLAKIWSYSIKQGTLELVAQHDPARFGNVGVPATAPFTQDEESSGIIPMDDILGEGWFLCDVQAHYNPGDAELVEGGQLVALHLPPGQEKRWGKRTTASE